MTEQPLSYWMAVARMGFEDDFSRLFENLGISRAELAERLGASPAYVSKILNGRNGNFQLETMAKLARAIGAIVQVRLIKESGEVVRVVDYDTAAALDDRRIDIAEAQNNPLRVLAQVVPIQQYQRRKITASADGDPTTSQHGSELILAGDGRRG